MMMMIISSPVKYSRWPDVSINRTEHSQKSLHLKNKWLIWDHETKVYETEARTSWDRGRDQDQLLWERDRKRGFETVLVWQCYMLYAGLQTLASLTTV